MDILPAIHMVVSAKELQKIMLLGVADAFSSPAVGYRQITHN